MLTDLLSTVAEGGKILLEEEDYLLARVEIEGRSMLAEISRGSAGGIPPGEWPNLSGILHPDSEIHPAGHGDTRILLFSVPEGSKLYLERLVQDGALSESGVMNVGRCVLAILRRLHDSGHRVGYLGPENVLATPSGDHFILGGCRGIPDTPFSPPEAVGSTAEDPRSDVYALGLLMFRLLAGSDNRNVQIEAWNKLSRGMLKLLENMVTPDTDERYPNLMVLSRKMSSTVPTSSGDVMQNGKCQRGSVNRRKFPFWGYIIAAVAVIAALVVMLGPGNGNHSELDDSPQDTSLSTGQIMNPAGDDTTIDVENVGETDSLPEQGFILDGEPVIWISNGSGRSGLASEFRQGPASDYSAVYACTGSGRNNSILLARRIDPTVPLHRQEELFNRAEELVSGDSTISILPVDVTILLGSDMLDDQVVPGILQQPSSPRGTLYVDIANHGVAGAYGGTGAATWVRSVIHDRSIFPDGQEWLIQVVDFRDGDMLNSELGIPSQLQSTGFLYRSGMPLLSEAETLLRSAIIDGSPSDYNGPQLPQAPDIWILLGQ